MDAETDTSASGKEIVFAPARTYEGKYPSHIAVGAAPVALVDHLYLDLLRRDLRHFGHEIYLSYPM